MKFTKSITIALSALAVITLLALLAKIIISKDKLIYYQIATADNGNILVEKQLLNIDNHWYYKAENNSKYADPAFNDEKWNSDRFAYMAIIKNGKSNIWLRKHFVIKQNFLTDTLYARLSLFDIQAAFYVNGKKVADSGFIYNRSVCYKFPANLLVKGKNVLAIYIRDFTSSPQKNIKQFTDELFDVLKPNINLEGSWKFKLGDNMQWAEKNYSDTSFKNIYVPKSWESQGLPNYDGFAWYKKKFICPPELQKQTLVFVSGKIDDYGEVFINGKKIGGHLNFKQNQASDWDTRYFYIIPNDILCDTITIAVRVLDLGGDGGIYEGPLGIISKDDLVTFIESKK